MKVYVIDNDALIRLQFMPPKAFPSVWALLERLAGEGRLIICQAVWIEYKNDEYKPWFEARKELFHCDYTPEQYDCLAAIGEFCPRFIEAMKPGHDADQPLVALAMSLNDKCEGCWASGPAVVVTCEKRNKGDGKVKVPDACDYFGVEAIDFAEMIAREGPI